MRMIVIKQSTDLQALATRLLGGAAGHEAGLQQLQRLNPHVDFKRIEPGSVLLVPDRPGFQRGESSSVSGQAVDALRTQLEGALQAVSARVREGHESIAGDRQDVAAVLKSAAVRRLIEADPDLAPQVEAATKVFKEDQLRAKESEKLLKQLHDGGIAELDALAKLLS
jgi:hypothetical protein